MIAYLEGKVAQLEPTFVIIDCGGIGYLVKITLNTYTQIRDKSSVKLHTYLQVREDAHILYGFFQDREKSLFEQLISISGVGGNTALMILSSISASDLYAAIQNEDTLALKRIKGIGAKTAGRIILELKDKIKIEGSVPAGVLQGGSSSMLKQEALAALTNLGLPKTIMAKRVDRIIQEQGGEISVEEIIKLALRNP